MLGQDRSSPEIDPAFVDMKRCKALPGHMPARLRFLSSSEKTQRAHQVQVSPAHYAGAPMFPVFCRSLGSTSAITLSIGYAKQNKAGQEGNKSTECR